MPYKFSLQSLGIPLDQVRPAVVVSATAPSTDQIWIKTTDNTVYLYYSGSWQSTGIVLTPAVSVTGNPIGLLLSLTYS